MFVSILILIFVVAFTSAAFIASRRPKAVEVWELKYILKGTTEPVIFRYPKDQYSIASTEQYRLNIDNNCKSVSLNKVMFKPPKN